MKKKALLVWAVFPYAFFPAFVKRIEPMMRRKHY